MDVITQFSKVKELTDDVNLIIEALAQSTVSWIETMKSESRRVFVLEPFVISLRLRLGCTSKEIATHTGCTRVGGPKSPALFFTASIVNNTTHETLRYAHLMMKKQASSPISKPNEIRLFCEKFRLEPAPTKCEQFLMDVVKCPMFEVMWVTHGLLLWKMKMKQ